MTKLTRIGEDKISITINAHKVQYLEAKNINATEFGTRITFMNGSVLDVAEKPGDVETMIDDYIHWTHPNVANPVYQLTPVTESTPTPDQNPTGINLNVNNKKK